MRWEGLRGKHSTERRGSCQVTVRWKVNDDGTDIVSFFGEDYEVAIPRKFEFQIVTWFLKSRYMG
jgi:hypothetical protein